MSEWPRYYVLVGRTPIAVDMLSWAESFEKRLRDGRTTGTDPWRVARDELDGCGVSTVFLGLDHRFGGSGDPILFETMIFGGPLDGEQWRAATYDEAERCHAAAVTRARIAGARIKAIAEAAGATEK